MKFDFSKSADADLQNKMSIMQFNTLNKNILYITHVVDRLDLKLNRLVNSINLQKQVDDFYVTNIEHDTIHDNVDDEK